MGTPVELIEYGNDCLFCFLIDKTPKIRWCKFKYIVKCLPEYPDPPNDRIFALYQNPVNPCLWHVTTDDGWHIELENYSAETRLILDFYNTLNLHYFFAMATTPCAQKIFNESFCPDYGAEGGFGIVWPNYDPIPWTLCEILGFHPGESNLYDKTTTIANMADYRIANKLDKTNVLLRVDTTVIGG